MNTKKNATNIKVGKRLRKADVDKLRQAIELLLNVAGYVNYEDEVADLLESVESENKAASRGDLAAIAARRAKPKKTSSGGGGGGSNWSAGVGQTIIGNLARGKGGRFISAENINAMTGQLGKHNISPDMFEGMQALLAGKPISEKVMEQLKAAGLATKDGQATSKTAQITNAMKTGEPDKLNEVLNPSEAGGGGGAGLGEGCQPDSAERAGHCRGAVPTDAGSGPGRGKEGTPDRLVLEEPAAV